MTTHHVYRRSLAGFLFFVLLLALCPGCAKTVSTDYVAPGSTNPDPCLLDSTGIAGEGEERVLTISDEPGADLDEAGVFLGYREPAYDDAASTWAVSEEGLPPSEMDGMEYGDCDAVTPGTDGGEKDGTPMMYEEPADEQDETDVSAGNEDALCDEDAYAPTVTEEPGTSWQTEDPDNGGSDTVAPQLDGAEEEETPMIYEKPAAEEDEAGMSAGNEDAPCDEDAYAPDVTEEPDPSWQTQDVDNDDSDTVAPGIDGEERMTPDADGDGATSGDSAAGTIGGPTWPWIHNVRIVTQAWWRAVVGVERGADLYEHEILRLGSGPCTGDRPRDAGANEAGHDSGPGPWP
jgi:hypothetical protein